MVSVSTILSYRYQASTQLRLQDFDIRLESGPRFAEVWLRGILKTIIAIRFSTNPAWQWKVKLQWGFEYRKHWYTKLFEVLISNGRFMDYVICTIPTIGIPDQHIRNQDGIHLSCIQMVGLSCIQMAFGYQTIWHPTSFWPFKYQTSLVFRSPLYFIRKVFVQRLRKAVSKRFLRHLHFYPCKTIWRMSLVYYKDYCYVFWTCQS